MTPALKKAIDQITNEIAILAGDIFKDDLVAVMFFKFFD